MKNLFFLTFMIVSLITAFTTSMEAQDTKNKELYKIGVKDVISIQVIGHPDLNIAAKVTVDGTIAYPHLGSIYVKDKTLLDIQEEITRKLSDGYVNYPVVSVSLVEGMSKRVFIHGEVMKNGMMPFEKDITIIQALSMAGGIKESGLYGKVKLRRKQKDAGYKDIMEADLDDGILMDSKMEDTLLQPDDILIVKRNESIFMQDQVAKPGRYTLESNMTVSRAITIAGGITEDGKHGKVKLRRKMEDKTGYLLVKESYIDDRDLTESEMEDMLLQPDDILKIERNESFFIEGEVASPGRYILEYDMTVGRAITVAGGITEGGMYGKVKVRRKREEKFGYEDIEIDLEGIMAGSETGDMFLKPDDILIIERNKTYTVYGEVNRIGEFPLANDTTVFKAILYSGGFTKWGSESRVKILRLANGNQEFETIKVNINDILDGDSDADVFLQPGDIVVVSSGIF